MKVKITKCSSDYYWYKDEIGKTYEVNGSPIIFGGFGGLMNDTWMCICGKRGILKEDCEVIDENQN